MESYSVLMSVYHKENPLWLEEAMDSMWGQTIAPAQMVLVCDGPLTAELDAVIARQQEVHGEKLCLVRLPQNGGLAAALNQGLPHCICDVVARMDTDDIAFPDRCEREISLMDRVDAHIVSGTVLEFESSPRDVTARKELPVTHEEIMAYASDRNPFNHPAVMFRKSWVDKVGGYEIYPLFEDYQLWLKLLLSGARGANLKDPVLYMRAGAEMYRRRGGWKYFQYAVRLERYKKERGLIGMMTLVRNTAFKGVVALIPASWREALYRKFLR